MLAGITALRQRATAEHPVNYIALLENTLGNLERYQKNNSTAHTFS